MPITIGKSTPERIGFVTTDDLVRYVRDELADDLRTAAASLTGAIDVLNALCDLIAATGQAADVINDAARQFTGSREILLRSSQALTTPADQEGDRSTTKPARTRPTRRTWAAPTGNPTGHTATPSRPATALCHSPSYHLSGGRLGKASTSPETPR